MKNWNELNTTDKEMLLVYEKSLTQTNQNDDEISESVVLTKYCLENDLDISMIPKKVLFDEEYMEMAIKMSPFTFLEYYKNTVFVGADKSVINIKKFLVENNAQKDLIEMITNGSSPEKVLKSNLSPKK
jgi:hypothetical protein